MFPASPGPVTFEERELDIARLRIKPRNLARLRYPRDILRMIESSGHDSRLRANYETRTAAMNRLSIARAA